MFPEMLGTGAVTPVMFGIEHFRTQRVLYLQVAGLFLMKIPQGMRVYRVTFTLLKIILLSI